MPSLRDKLYLTSGYLSGFCIVAITLIIVAQIVGRLLGMIVPSAEDFSGYFLAAATFLGLAYTFREGGHIRVNLVIRWLPPGLRRLQESAVLLSALLLSMYMSYYCCYMVWESYIFEEVSYGYIAIPIWIPQVPVALGTLALTLAIADALYGVVCGQKAQYLQREDDNTNLEEI
ncbi:TRAP transporter small permease [Aestuariirhabdus sp. Z084]|uniref:TRAP transporter small permease n=1 Tax=Aestuariirhabdus haliotis TaxID=2918751 RepID=UPI00201B3BFB|nr:TRAP transporter small permease [Aestuariirhabdus haliotis]MCL6414251.1 TRAP transporter small permease [Aestuariirhabdus haliotis]MCL6418183.1 TRAP transporter small permease [Aestuariirhabdus haliotis]